jgi:hypothetical protein
MPFVLAGRAGGAIRTGRFLSFEPANQRLHNDLLVSMLNAFDIPSTTFGNAEWNKGALPGLL